MRTRLAVLVVVGAFALTGCQGLPEAHIKSAECAITATIGSHAHCTQGATTNG